MGKLCRCERCSRVVERKSTSAVRATVYVAAYGVPLPYAWLLFVAGPGVAGVAPIVFALGLSVDMVLRDWAFPRPLCQHCGASLEHAPLTEPAGAPALSARRV